MTRRDRSTRVPTKSERAQRYVRASPIGDQSRSATLGEADPRHRRGAQAVQEMEVRYTDQFRVRTDGKLSVELVEGAQLRAAGAVDNLAAGAVLADVVAKVNELLEAQRRAGQMEGKV